MTKSGNVPIFYEDVFLGGYEQGSWKEKTNKPNKYSRAGTNTKPVLDSQDDAVSANWGGRWRMPRDFEIRELLKYSRTSFERYRGVAGIRVVGPNGNSLFLPFTNGDAGNYRSASNSSFTSSVYSSTTSSVLYLFNNYGQLRRDRIMKYNGEGIAVRGVYGDPNGGKSTITISIASDQGSQISVDGRVSGYSCLESIELSQGSHHIHISKDGYSDFEVDLSLTLDDCFSTYEYNLRPNMAIPSGGIRLNKQNIQQTIQQNSQLVIFFGTERNPIKTPYEAVCKLQAKYSGLAFAYFDALALSRAEWQALLSRYNFLKFYPTVCIFKDGQLVETIASLKDKNGWEQAIESAIINNGLSARPFSHSQRPPVDASVYTVDLGLSVKWASCNLGAKSPEEYGYYYAWGETEPKEDYRWATYKFRTSGDSFNNVKFSKYNTDVSYGTIDNKTVLDPEDDVAHVKLGGSWRIPTQEEWTELRTRCNWTWTKQNGVNGYKVTGPNGKSIFLPAAGSRTNSDLYCAGSDGYYCSSSLITAYPIHAWNVYFDSDNVSRYNGGYRYLGHSVRPVSE